MKREDIKKLLPDISDEVLNKIMDENGKDIEAAKAKYADYDTIKKQLGEAGQTIEGFKALDIDGIKKAADNWKLKAETAEKDAAAKIADMQFSGLLEGAITSAKGKNAKAVKALLDLDALKTSKNQETDVKAALDALKKDNGYLFDDAQTTTTPSVVTKTGGDPPPVNNGDFRTEMSKQLFGK